jgi:hypothetical protein
MAENGHQIYCHIPLEELKQMQRQIVKLPEHEGE